MLTQTQIDQGGALEFNGDKGLDTKCFRILLQAVYNEPYEIADNDVLCLLVDLADYIVFCVLCPALWMLQLDGAVSTTAFSIQTRARCSELRRS